MPLLDFFVQSSHILNGNNGIDFFVAEAASVNGRWREGAAVMVMEEGLGMMTVEASARVLCTGMLVATEVLVAFGLGSSLGSG